MQRLSLILLLVFSFTGCISSPDKESRRFVLQLPQPQYNVALAVANATSLDLFVEAVKTVSTIYSDGGNGDAAFQLGNAILEMVPAKDVSRETLQRYFTALRILGRSLPSSDWIDYRERVIEEVRASASPRFYAGLFEALSVSEDADPEELRSIVDDLYSFEISESRTAALIRVARTTIRQGRNGSLNSIVQQTIPTMTDDAPIINRVADFVSMSYFSWLLEREGDRETMRSEALSLLEADEVRISARDEPLLFQALDDLIVMDDFTAASRLAAAIAPYSIRASAFLYLADQAYRKDQTQLSRGFLDLAAAAGEHISDRGIQATIAGRLLVSYALLASSNQIGDFSSWIEEAEHTVYLEASKDATAFMLGTFQRSDIPVQLQRDRVETVLSILSEIGADADVERIMDFLTARPDFIPGPRYGLILMERGRITEGLYVLTDQDYSDIETRETLIQALVTIPLEAEISAVERTLLGHILEKALSDGK